MHVGQISITSCTSTNRRKDHSWVLTELHGTLIWTLSWEICIVLEIILSIRFPMHWDIFVTVYHGPIIIIQMLDCKCKLLLQCSPGCETSCSTQEDVANLIDFLKISTLSGIDCNNMLVNWCWVELECTMLSTTLKSNLRLESVSGCRGALCNKITPRSRQSAMSLVQLICYVCSAACWQSLCNCIVGCVTSSNHNPLVLKADVGKGPRKSKPT